MDPLSLLSHPATPAPYIDTVTARVDRISDDLLVLYYSVAGDIDQLKLPAQRRSGPADRLWQHTCFEAYIRAGDARSYVELNFSPSSEWAAYRFESYRQGFAPLQPQQPPKIVCRRREDRLEADVDVHLSGLASRPDLHFTARLDLRLALAAVLEDQQGRLSYWAIAHPPGAPDFHHDDGFVVRVPAAKDGG